MAALTQNMIDALQQAGQNNTTALLTGMKYFAAQRKLAGILNLSGDSNSSLVIDEWFKIAKRNLSIPRKILMIV